MSNKERARKARQRKKKYYEDLEQRANYLEDLCKKLTKEVQFYKHKVRLFECSNKNTGKMDLNRDIRMIDSLIEKAKEMDSKDSKIFDTLQKIYSGYSAMGTEKMKILENSFDIFLENILWGTDFKAVFYAADKQIPETWAECQSYLKLKKFQKYELYPDENVRDFLDIKLSATMSEEGYLNLVKNKMPILKEIKDEMRNGIFQLFKGKEMIYKALMKNNALNRTYATWKMDKKAFINYLEEMKHSNLKMTYREAFEIIEEEVDYEVKLEIPDPDALRAMKIVDFNACEDELVPSIYENKYKMKIIKCES